MDTHGSRLEPFKFWTTACLASWTILVVVNALTKGAEKIKETQTAPANGLSFIYVQIGMQFFNVHTPRTPVFDICLRNFRAFSLEQR